MRKFVVFHKVACPSLSIISLWLSSQLFCSGCQRSLVGTSCSSSDLVYETLASSTEIEHIETGDHSDVIKRERTTYEKKNRGSLHIVVIDDELRSSSADWVADLLNATAVPIPDIKLQFLFCGVSFGQDETGQKFLKVFQADDGRQCVNNTGDFLLMLRNSNSKVESADPRMSNAYSAIDLAMKEFREYLKSNVSLFSGHILLLTEKNPQESTEFPRWLMEKRLRHQGFSLDAAVNATIIREVTIKINESLNVTGKGYVLGQSTSHATVYKNDDDCEYILHGNKDTFLKAKVSNGPEKAFYTDLALGHPGGTAWNVALLKTDVACFRHGAPELLDRELRFCSVCSCMNGTYSCMAHANTDLCNCNSNSTTAVRKSLRFSVFSF